MTNLKKSQVMSTSQSVLVFIQLCKTSNSEGNIVVLSLPSTSSQEPHGTFMQDGWLRINEKIATIYNIIRGTKAALALFALTMELYVMIIHGLFIKTLQYSG